MGSLRLQSGSSDKSNPRDAGNEAAEEIADELDDPGLVFVFSGSELADERLLEAIRTGLNNPTVIGCSTGGELSPAGIKTGSVVVLGLESDHMTIGTGRDVGIEDDARETGKKAAEQAIRDIEGEQDDTTFSVFSTALTGNGSDVMRGVRDASGDDAHVTGGLAGDDWKLEQTYVYHNGSVITDGLVVAAIDGPQITHGIKHGLETTEHQYTVTASDDNIVRELDGRPVAEIYEELYGVKGKTANFIMTKPLGMEVGEDELRLRDPLVINDDGSIVYAAEVQEGTNVHIMESPKDAIIDAARAAAKEALEAAGNPPEEDIEGVILHDCVCRWNCLSDDATRRREVTAVQEILGDETPLIGWYTYGEIALPRALAGVHNQTLVLQLFVDRTEAGS